MRACGPDRFSGFLAFVAREIVEDHDVGRLEKRDELGFDPGLEAFAVDGAIKHPGRIDAASPEPGHEGERLPVPMGRPALKRGTAFAPAAQTGHVGLDPGLIHKDEPSWINLVLVRFPALAKARRLGPHLLLSEHGFFYC